VVLQAPPCCREQSCRNCRSAGIYRGKLERGASAVKFQMQNLFYHWLRFGDVLVLGTSDLLVGGAGHDETRFTRSLLLSSPCGNRRRRVCPSAGSAIVVFQSRRERPAYAR